MENLKALVIGVITGIAAYLNPIAGDIVSMLAVFALNFIFGLLAAIVACNESFSFRKAWKCVTEATVFFVLVCSVYFIGKQKNNIDGAMQCISFVSYSVFYFYGVNMLRNMKLLLPGSRTIAFIYDVVSIEFAKKFPGLSHYIEKTKNSQKDDNSNTIKEHIIPGE